MNVTIDRFEGNYAVCEQDNGIMINILKDKIPPEAKEGDILEVNGDIITIDHSKTAKRKKSIENLTKDLWD